MTTRQPDHGTGSARGGGTRADSGELRDRVAGIARPFVEAAGLDLEEVDVRGQRGSRVVRVVVDSDEGVDIDRCAELSREIGGLLDAEDFISGRYTLEVTSPGVDRPLRSVRQFRRNVGRQVRVVRTRAAIDAGHKGEVVGELVAVDDAGVTLDVDGSRIPVPFGEVDHGKVVLPW